jgi:hypothetical protein
VGIARAVSFAGKGRGLPPARAHKLPTQRTGNKSGDSCQEFPDLAIPSDLSRKSELCAHPFGDAALLLSQGVSFRAGSARFESRSAPMTTVTLRMPVDVVDSLKEIAPQRGFSGYQALLKWYVSEGLRRDEARYTFGPTARLIAALKQRGVADALLDEAVRETTDAAQN